MNMCGKPTSRKAARIIQTPRLARVSITAIGIAAAITGCGTQIADASHAANHHSQELILRTRPRQMISRHLLRQDAAVFRTTRMFRLGAGRMTRTFTIRERGGVILSNQLTVRHGVRAFVDARIPGVAGAKVWSWPASNRPSASCRMDGSFEVCAQREEWCPMPEAIWQFRLVKLSGPAGPIRFDFVVAARPHQS